MEKKPEVDGAYVEINAAELITREDEARQSSILVVVNPRLEFAGDELEQFLSKFHGMATELVKETADLDDEQKSFYILRQMLIL